MKVAYISDLHLENRPGVAIPLLEGKWHRLRDLGFPEEIDADVIVIAGDVHKNPAFRRVVYKGISDAYGVPVVSVDGNHDVYGRDFPANHAGVVAEIKGVRFAATTLWTHLSVLDQSIAHQFMDFRQISALDPLTWNQTHAMQLEFLRQSGAEVIVTHHTPSERSSHPRFASNPFNGFFTNNLDLSQFGRLKLWIHGHVHDEWDYVEQGIRVVCNPLGYPMELHRRGAQIKIIEV